MGSVVKVTSIFDTTAGNKSVAFGSTCASGNTIAVFAAVSTLTTSPTITDNLTGGTYTAVGNQVLRSGSGSCGQWYIRNNALSSTATPTVTMTSSGDAGGGFIAYELTGVVKTGTAAVRGKGNANNQASGSTPTVTLDQTPLTTSIILGGITSAVNSSTQVTPPTSFTERFDNGFNTPASGMESASRDSGHTSTTVAWGSTLAAAYGVAAIEIDTTAPAAAGHSQPHFRIRSDDSQTINANAGWAAALDTNATLDAEAMFRIRFDVSNSTASEGLSYKLQYRYTPNGGAAGSWTDVKVSTANPRTVREAVEIRDSAQFADQVATTQVISTGTFVAGVGDENNNTGAITLASGAHTELEWPLSISRTYGTTANSTTGENREGDTFEFRVVSTNNDIFGGTYVNPTITLNVPDGLIGGTYVETPSDILFQDANENLYYFMEGADTNAQPFMEKSTDNGVSWRVQDHANRPGYIDYEAADIAQATTELFILHQQSNTVYLHSFRTSNHATNPDTWNIKGESVATPTVSDQFCSIVRRSDGTLVAFYSTTPSGSATYTTGYKVRSSGGVWGSETLLDSTANINFTGASAVLAESDITYVFYVDSTNGVLYMKTLSATNVLSARTQVATGLATTAANQYNAVVPSPRYYVLSGTNYILLAYVKSDDKLYSMLLINGALQTERGVTTETVQVDSSGTTSRAPAAGLDVSTLGTARLVYSNASNGDIYMRWASSNGIWSGVAVLLVNPVNVTGFVSVRSYPDSATLYTGVIYDTAGGKTGEIRFFPVLLGVKSHTTDGYVSAGASQVTKTHTTNAIVKATLTKTHTTDALVKATLTRTHTSDALVKATLTKTHTTDALVKATLTRTHTSDALIKATLTRTHTTNAIVRATLTRSHTSDSIIKATLTRTHTSDAFVRKTLTRTHSTDAIVVDSTLQLWLKADAITGLNDGDAVASWVDSAAYNRPATQGTGAAQPVYKTNILNGQPVIRFDGTDDFLDVADAAGLSFANEQFTLIAVSKQSASGVNSGILRKPSTETGGWEYSLGRLNTVDEVRPNAWTIGGTNVFSFAGHTSGTAAGIYSFSADGTTAYLRKNGGNAKTGSKLTEGMGDGSGPLGIGQSGGAAGPFFHSGDIAEILIYNRNLTDSEREAVESYLAVKYGIPLIRTHTSDAYVVASFTRTHTTDALVQATLTKVHTTNAIVRATLTRTHTTNAIVRATLTRTHTTDAIVRATLLRTHTTDATTRATLLRTHTTDAVVPSRLTATHTTNALVRATLSRTHTTDAIVRATLTRTHTTNAIVRATLLRTHTTDALVKATLTRTHSTDGYVSVAGAVTVTHTTNAIIRASLTRTHTSDAVVVKTAALTHTTNAFVRATQTRTHTTNAVVRATLTRVHTSDAVVRKTLALTHTTDALVYLRSTKTHTTNAFVQVVALRTHTTNAHIRGTLTRQHTTDADIKKTLTRSHTTDYLVGVPYKTSTHTTNAYIHQPYPQWPQTHGVAAWLQDTGQQWPQGG